MRLTSNLRIWCGFLFAVLIALASVTVSAPASAGEPAQVVILDGPAAALLESQNKPIKPVVRGLTGEDGGTRVVLFASDPQRAAELPGELFSTDLVPDCEGGVEGGVECCDPTKGMMVVNATYNGQNGWVQTGELCEPHSIEVDEAPPSVSSELSGRFGITYCLMKIVDDKGYPKVLVNGSVEECLQENHSDAEEARPTMARAAAQGGALWLTSLITVQKMPQATSPIILASHCQSQRPTACPGTDKGTTFCGMAADRQYSLIAGLWCRFGPCGPC